MSTTSQVKVRVELFADLRSYAPPEGATMDLELPAGTTMHQVIERFGIPADYEVTIGRNGERAMREDTVEDGDTLLLFSPMEGG